MINHEYVAYQEEYGYVGDDGGGQERRGSCRYPVADVPVQLSWWETVEGPRSTPASDAPVSRDETTRPKGAGAGTYAAMMARGPAFRRGGQPSGDVAEERRAEARREAEAATQAEGPQLRYCVGRLVDISQTGLSLVCEAVPAAGQRVWARLEGPSPTEWVEVSPRGDTLQEPGLHLIRFAFLQTCPYDFFKVAVYGRPGA
jgi:hypothetical protein